MPLFEPGSPRKYVLVFGLFAAWLVALAAALGGWGWLLLWPALSFALFAAAYAGLGPGVFAKRSGGLPAWWSPPLMLPVVALLWSLWHLRRLADREPCCHEVAPGLWLGRRPLARELPPGVALVVDLTAELPPARGVRQGRDYRVLPTLDSYVPGEGAFLALVEQVASHPGPIYLHCAQGHGRSAALAAAVLVRRGLAADVGQAEGMLRQVRRGVRLTPAQRRFLRRVLGSESAQ